MAEDEAVEKAHEDEREGKSPSTQAGEFVREEIRHVREGQHGARNVQQAIAIGLSKARRAGVKLPAPRRGSAKLKKQAARDSRRGRSKHRGTSKTRSRAIERALRREGHRSASRRALAAQARRSARRRGPAARRAAARKAARTRQRRRV